MGGKHSLAALFAAESRARERILYTLMMMRRSASSKSSRQSAINSSPANAWPGWRRNFYDPAHAGRFSPSFIVSSQAPVCPRELDR
jgi:hypothetical protein